MLQSMSIYTPYAGHIPTLFSFLLFLSSFYIIHSDHLTQIIEVPSLLPCLTSFNLNRAPQQQPNLDPFITHETYRTSHNNGQ